MDKLSETKAYIENVLKHNRFAVLATEGDGRPHASFIAITPMESYRVLVFATYRNTQKYRNLTQNRNVALLIESGSYNSSEQRDSFVLTAFGHSEEIRIEDHEDVFNAHLAWHPDLMLFMGEEDCTLVRIKVNSYQVVRGIDDVEWWTIVDLEAMDSD